MKTQILRVTTETAAKEYPLSYYSVALPKRLDAMLISGDIADIRKNFSNIRLIEIISESSLVVFSTTELVNLSGSLELNINFWMDEDTKETKDCIKISLYKLDIEEKLKRLEDIVSPAVNENEMTLEEFKAYKTSQLGDACSAAIYDGMDVETSNGAEHFSYKEEDQRNLKALADVAMACSCNLPYHADQKQCTAYPYLDIIHIYSVLQKNLLYHTTYCNALNTLVRKCGEKGAATNIAYGMEILDKDVLAEMNTALRAGLDAMETVFGSVNENVIKPANKKSSLN